MFLTLKTCLFVLGVSSLFIYLIPYKKFSHYIEMMKMQTRAIFRCTKTNTQCESSDVICDNNPFFYGHCK